IANATLQLFRFLRSHRLPSRRRDHESSSRRVVCRIFFLFWSLCIKLLEYGLGFSEVRLSLAHFGKLHLYYSKLLVHDTPRSGVTLLSRPSTMAATCSAQRANAVAFWLS